MTKPLSLQACMQVFLYHIISLILVKEAATPSLMCINELSLVFLAKNNMIHKISGCYSFKYHIKLAAYSDESSERPILTKNASSALEADHVCPTR